MVKQPKKQIRKLNRKKKGLDASYSDAGNVSGKYGGVQGSMRASGSDEHQDAVPDLARSRMLGAFTVFALAIALAVFGVISIFMPKPEVSQIENRPLEKAPSFSMAALASGKLTDAFSRFYSDTFPWRENMIESSSDFKSLFGMKGKEGDQDVSIHFGVDTAGGKDDAQDAKGGKSGAGAGGTGAAISAGGVASPGAAGATSTFTEEDDPNANNRLTGEGEREGGVIVVGDTALEFYGFSKNTNDKYVSIVNRFEEKYRGRITTAAIVVPTNIEFKLPEKYADLSDSQRKAIDYIYGNMNGGVKKIDVYNTMKKHAGEYIYFRTDHHWTQLGAFYAYRNYCAAMGLPHTGLLSYQQRRLDGFLGSFYNSIGGNSAMKANPDYVLAYLPVVPYKAMGYENSYMSNGFEISLVRTPEEIPAANKYLAFSGGDMPLLHIKMESNTGRRLIIFKESYANAFIPFLTENYDEILVVDFRYYEGDANSLIDEYQINEALFLNYVSAAGSERQVDRLATLF
ncbi:MAG: hypothetical protein LBG82_08130 [Clostridiales Family XIII bacterium]|nr:hypothetical protein [Clostridiales Family XIII bacterium]